MKKKYDDQIRSFRNVLINMSLDIVNDSIKNRSENMSRAIVDGWPYESKLGRLIVNAKYAYHQLSR